MELRREKNKIAYLAFPMVDSASPESFKAGETVSDTAYYKDGAGVWTSLAITDTVSQIGSTGVYELDLTAAEMNHDKILIKLTAANSQDTLILINTVPTVSNVTEWDDTAVTGDGDWAELQTDVDAILVDTGTSIPNQIGAGGAALNDLGGMSTAMKAEVQAECEDAITAQEPIDANVTQVGGVAEDIATETKQDIIDGNVDAILVDTAEIGLAGAGLTDLGGMSTGMKAEVNAEADQALTDYDPPTKAELDTAETNIITEVNANETKIDTLQTDMTAVKNIIIALPMKKNTAFTDFEFQMFDSTTGDPKTLLSVTAERSLDGGAYTAMANAVTEVASGTYKINIAAADINCTTGTWKFTATGAKTTYITFLTYL